MSGGSISIYFQRLVRKRSRDPGRLVPVYAMWNFIVIVPSQVVAAVQVLADIYHLVEPCLGGVYQLTS